MLEKLKKIDELLFEALATCTEQTSESHEIAEVLEGLIMKVQETKIAVRHILNSKTE